jgi:hypothetical protein
MDNRPQGRDTHVTGAGKEIKKRGSGLNTGPVGSTPSHSSSGSRPESSSGNRPAAPGGSRPVGRNAQTGYGSAGGQRASGGRSPLLTIIIAAVVLLGGGGFGLNSLLGGGGDSQPASGYTEYYDQSSQSYNQGSQGYNQGGQSSGQSGIDISSILSGLGGQSSSAGFLGSSVGNVSNGWTGSGGSNASKLNTSVDPAARAKYTNILGGGKDTVTIMVYMCGSDLESKSGMGTADLMEMTKATLSDHVNLIVYTGGATRWKNDVVSSSVNQIYKIESGGKLRRLVQDAGSPAMTDPATLTSFIKYCSENFPANRNELILWDHGGGSISGYGYDEKSRGSASMGLSGISKALKNAGITFDFIGFDACLMGTLENALTLTPYADYLIASEETEPGIGWYYTNWLTELSNNTSLSTLEVGKRIIDDFVEACNQKCAGQKTTLSIVDLAELEKTVPAKFSAFASGISSLLENKEYKVVSDARAGAREFAASSQVDQVDLVHLAYKLDTAESKALAQTLLNAVKYNRTSSSITNAYGISIYFPYQKMNRVQSAANAYNAIGLDSNYTRCIQQFASVEASAQAASGGTVNPFGALTGSGSSGISSDFLSSMLGSFLGGSSSGGISGLGGANSGFLGKGLPAEDISAYLNEYRFDPSALVWQSVNGETVMALSEEQWSLVHDLTLNVFYDDGEGYIDLGLDNVYTFTEDGALLGEYDGTWLAIDEQVVAYYYVDSVFDGDTYTIVGRVPVMITHEDNDPYRAELIIVFDNDHPYGTIAGARAVYANGETETVAKGVTELDQGDKLDFICDYYSYAGDYQNSYYLGEQMIYTGDHEISNVMIDKDSAVATYLLADIYNQEYWTPVLP